METKIIYFVIVFECSHHGGEDISFDGRATTDANVGLSTGESLVELRRGPGFLELVLIQGWTK